MEEAVKKMLPLGATIPDIEFADYSFAIEYRGPPVCYKIPEAMPIVIEQIPVASAVSPASLPDHLSLPVIHPLSSSPPLKKFPKDILLASDPIVASPTSVIAFENHAEMSGEVGSSGALESSCYPDRSREMSEGIDISGAVGFSSELKGRVSADSAVSSEFGFRSSASCDDDEGLSDQVKRSALVTFQELTESSGAASSPIETSCQEREEEYNPRAKKGCCYRCFKGNRFTEKEVCLVCDAKYCSSCVLKAMGSMPEGRKCVSCIGSPIEESKRERLGKGSRMLKRLLSSLEVEQLMKAEKDCEANQLTPESVCVNGKQLNEEEMLLLQTCPCPPTKLKPGYYWYDKVLGYWGKQGHKPDKIITANLNVGGSLMRNASNGDTGILINGREITKAEMQMLKWAGVQCAGYPHFWVNADGTYQEEGQKNIKGQIWGRTRMKLLCSFLSLPVPSKDANPSGEELNNMLNRALPDYLEQRTVQKLLLVGYPGSGTSTIFKQAKFLYKSIPFSEHERQSIKLMIQSKIYSYLGILLEGRERFEEEALAEGMHEELCDSSGTSNDESDECDGVTVYSIGPRLKAFSDWFLKIMASGDLETIFPAGTREYAPIVEELWNCAAIQATYSRRSELQLLPSVASYFLERVVDISRVEYQPSDLDILYADEITPSNGLACTDFFFRQSSFDGSGNDAADQHDTLLRYQLLRLHTEGIGDTLKWLDMFEDVRIVMFCVALSNYDEYYEDANGVVVNRMMESKRLFERIASHQAFDQRDFLLILNKFDLLEQKIDKSPLTSCDWFHDFNPVMGRNRPTNSSNSRSLNNGATMAQMAYHYIAVKFKRLFASLTDRKLYITCANSLDSNSADSALRYAREILRWEDERPLPNDLSSSDPSTFSH